MVFYKIILDKDIIAWAVEFTAHAFYFKKCMIVLVINNLSAGLLYWFSSSLRSIIISNGVEISEEGSKLIWF